MKADPKNYVAYLSGDYYVHSKNDSSLLEWASEQDGKVADYKVIAKAETLEECKEKAFAECEGSRWCMYPSLIIEEPGGGEVYSDILVQDKCNCCGHETSDRIVTDLEAISKRRI